MFTNLLRSGLVGLLLTYCAAASAAAQPPLDLAAVLDQTLRHHPVLARIDAEKRRLDPMVTLARQSPPLSLGLDAENLSDDGSQRLETTLSLAGVLEWGGQADARANLVLSDNQAIGLNLAQQRRDVLAQAASRFIALVGTSDAVKLAQQNRQFASKTHVATQRRQQLGAASNVDVQRAGLALAQADMALEQTEQARYAAGKALQFATGAPKLTFESLASDLAGLPSVPKLEALLQLAESSPAVVLADARMNVARSQFALAQRQSRPPIGWTLGIRDDREREDQSVVLGLSLPLGQSSRSRPQTEHAQAGLEVAESSRQIVQLEIQSLLLDTWQALANWKREAQALDTRLIPQSEAIASGLREGYARGRYSLLALISAEQDLSALRAQRLAARIHFHQSWIELERLLGRPLISENPS